MDKRGTGREAGRAEGQVTVSEGGYWVQFHQQGRQLEPSSRGRGHKSQSQMLGRPWELLNLPMDDLLRGIHTRPSYCRAGSHYLFDILHFLPDGGAQESTVLLTVRCVSRKRLPATLLMYE